jgi:hypothetical protein
MISRRSHLSTPRRMNQASFVIFGALSVVVGYAIMLFRVCREDLIMVVGLKDRSGARDVRSLYALSV